MASAEELKSRQVAEDAREKQWLGASFMKELFLGNFRLELMEPFPLMETERPHFKEFYTKLERFLREKVDPVKIDESGEYPPEVVRGLAELGAFGMKIPQEYGGLGLTHPEYVKAMELLGSHDSNCVALLSAHQAIGVPQPVKLFGSEELKKKYLPRCAAGAISAFALTEHAVGSDPARLETIAELSADGTHYILNGEKLWCTNGTLAEVIVVMARNPKNNKINCFVVEMDWPGIKVEKRCHFMGLRALANGVISFTNVRVPAENLVGKDGSGLRIALTTLNTGRLSLPAATAGMVKKCLEIVRKWCNARVQWGLPIGKHEAISHKLADIGATAYAMEAVSEIVGDMADRKGVDIRLEAAAAKEWNTVRAWRMVDETLQIRGGRGYETEGSLLARGEPGIGVERMVRDCRINMIFEGSSEVMHLFMAREAVDKHLEVAGALIDPKATVGQKLAALPKIALFYALWYPTRWLGFSFWPKFGRFGKLAKHLRYAERMTRKLAREIFHGMMVFQAGMERKQGFLFRAVDIATEIFAMTASITKAQRLKELGKPEAESAVHMADMFARNAERKIDQLFYDLWANDDAFKTAFGKSVLDGRHQWLEGGIVNLPFGADALRPPTVSEILAARDGRTAPTDEAEQSAAQ